MELVAENLSIIFLYLCRKCMMKWKTRGRVFFIDVICAQSIIGLASPGNSKLRWHCFIPAVSHSTDVSYLSYWTFHSGLNFPWCRSCALKHENYCIFLMHIYGTPARLSNLISSHKRKNRTHNSFYELLRKNLPNVISYMYYNYLCSRFSVDLFPIQNMQFINHY